MFPLASEETLQVKFGKTRAELSEQVDRHTLAVQSWLSSRSPQAKQFEGRGVRASSTGFQIPLLNLALGFRFPADAKKAEIENEIEAVKDFFAARQVPWYWWMTSSPSHVRELLQRHGLRLDEGVPPLPAMAAALNDMSAHPTFQEDIHVWQADSITDLCAASTIRRTAFRFPPGEALTYFEDMAPDWIERSDVRLYLAGKDRNEPVSIGAMIVKEGIPGVYVMATLPDHSRKGYGKAILSRLMSDAKVEGHSILALTASRAGFGLYSQFGFEHIFGFDLFLPADWSSVPSYRSGAPST